MAIPGVDVNAGSLDTRLTFEELLKSERNSISGIEEEKWVPKFRVWGSRRYESATEAVLQGGRQVAASSVLFRIRYRPDVDAKMRISVEGERSRYYINGTPERIGRREALVIRCTQRAD